MTLRTRLQWKIVGGIVGSAVAIWIVSYENIAFQESLWAQQLRHDVPLGMGFADVQAYLVRNHVAFEVAPAHELTLGPGFMQPYDANMFDCSFTVPTVYGRSAPIESVFLFRKGKLAVRQVLYQEGEDTWKYSDGPS